MQGAKKHKITTLAFSEDNRWFIYYVQKNTTDHTY